MSTHNHVIMLNQFTQYFKHQASLLSLTEVLTLALTSNSQTKVHEQGCGILKTVLREGL